MKQDRKSILESALGKHLAPVKAPDALWTRVKNAQPNERNAPAAVGLPWLQWAAAAATLAIVGAVGAGVWWVQNLENNPASAEAMAVAALDGGPESLGLRTDNTAQIRTWVKANTGIDIPLSPKHSSVIQVIGARVIDGPNPLAEVSYKVDGYRAALLVARDPTGKKTYPNHGFHASDRLHSARVTSWSMRGQSYTLALEASGDEFETACLLCHDQTPRLPTAARRL